MKLHIRSLSKVVIMGGFLALPASLLAALALGQAEFNITTPSGLVGVVNGSPIWNQSQALDSLYGGPVDQTSSSSTPIHTDESSSWANSHTVTTATINSDGSITHDFTFQTGVNLPGTGSSAALAEGNLTTAMFSPTASGNYPLQWSINLSASTTPNPPSGAPLNLLCSGAVATIQLYDSSSGQWSTPMWNVVQRSLGDGQSDPQAIFQTGITTISLRSGDAYMLFYGGAAQAAASGSLAVVPEASTIWCGALALALCLMVSRKAVKAA
ncbi:MAG: hypothetical protein ABSF95_15150 [Verrucomicrobiota bacterium]|jgi:hypothetical protein